MHCTDIEPKLVAWQDQELSPGEATQVAEHLHRCPRCRALEARLAVATPEDCLVVPGVVRDAFADRLDAALDAEFDRPRSDAQPPTQPAATTSRWLDGALSVPAPLALAYAALFLLVAGWGLTQWKDAQDLRIALEGARPATTTAQHDPVPVDVPADQFMPAAYAPPAPPSPEPR